MTKIGKASVKKVKEDKEEKESRGNQTFARFFTFDTGTNFIRMLPPSEGMDIPWIEQRRHFSLGKNLKGFSPCTDDGEKCFICKNNRKDTNSPKKEVREIADKRKVSKTNLFQMVNVNPLYTKIKKGKKITFKADNPPPKCWGNIEKDDEGEFSFWQKA